MGEKVGGGALMADEQGEGMQCSDHPYRNNPGGICAFCLQEKLGKLVSSSKFSDPFFSIPPPPSSSSSPPSFPSSDLPALPSSNRISFLSSKHRRRKMKTNDSATLNRSKSVAVAPRRPRGEIADASNSPRKKSFWSFLTLTYSSSTSSAPIPTSFISKRRSTSSASSSSAIPSNCVSEIPKIAKDDEVSAGNDDASPSGSQASSSFGRKVARSRSVGCGSRSFSGDFLERISNGFGDCTLRRVESHRESKQKVSIHRGDHHENDDDDDEQRIKERIKCGGIFVGLGMTTYWLSATAAADACGDTVALPAARRANAPHGRNKSWGWAFASPMRAFRPGGGGGGGQTTIIATGGDTAGGHRSHRC